MSLIDKKNLNYLTEVEQFFLSLKDSGLSLSANDYNLITEWEDRGVPLRLLCRSIEISYVRIIERDQSPIRRVSLAILKDMVELEIRRASK
ncbi:MAG: hypothetical protein ACQ9MH_07590 [Nitrospinales bacterium]